MEIDIAFRDLDRWITANGWAGYDPYDLRGQDWYVSIFGGSSRAMRKLRGLLSVVEQQLPPLALRRLLRVRPTINAKGVALLASAYLTKHRLDSQGGWLAHGERALDWLDENPSSGYPGRSWGYPFHWNSRQFLPRGTPSVVVTGVAGDAWFEYQALTGATRAVEALDGIAQFYREGLNRSVDDGEQLCFSYTPLDRFKVHNANLFAAAFLARYSALTGDADAADLARRATRYTLSEQNADGSFYYWGSEPPTQIDHYHTGFVLRHLDTVRRNVDADFVDQPLAAGLEFYLQRMFTADGEPKYTPDALYPVNIHSCAEALLCLAQFDECERLQAAFKFTQTHMRSDEGWYIAEMRRHWMGTRRIEIPYLRWGQAWMLLALARAEAACGLA